MEYERPEPDTPENKDKKSEKKSRKRRGFWPPWLPRLSKDTEGEPVQDLAGEQIDKPAKGFLETFKKLFRRHVEAEPVAYEAEPEATVADIDPAVAESPFRRPNEADDTSEHKTDSPLEAKPEAVPKPEKGSKDKEAGVLRIKHDEEPVVPEFPSPTIPTAAELHRLSAEPALAGSEQASNRPEVTKSPDKTGKNREPLAAATLVGLGAEYVARKRENRKQDKRIERLDRKVGDQLKEVERVAAAKPTMPERPVRDGDRIHQPAAREAFIFTDKETEMVQKKATKAEKATPKPEAKAAPVENREKAAEEVAKKVEEYERLHKAPAAVLKEMLTAAEINAPVEKIYERRQEVRDEPAGNQAHGATPVGTILHGMQAAPQVPRAKPAGISPRKDGEITATANLAYKQAAQRGFWGAIVILIFALMVYLLS